MKARIKTIIHQNPKLFILIGILLFIGILRFVILYERFHIRYQKMEGTHAFQVMVICNEVRQEDKISYFVSYGTDKFLLQLYPKEKQNDFLLLHGQYQYGDILTFRGKLTIPKKQYNPYEFDYRRYLNSLGIVGTMTASAVNFQESKIGNPLLFMGYRLREKIGEKVKNTLPEREAEVWKSMVYGDDRQLDPSVKEDFQKNGISHMLAVSGTHVASLMLLLNWVLQKSKKHVANVIKLVLLLLFCIISALELSVIRAGIMTCLAISATAVGKKLSIYYRLGIAFLLLFLYNPYCIFHAGFVLSFLATLGIAMFAKSFQSFFSARLSRIFHRIPGKEKEMSRLSFIFFHLFQYLSSLLALTLASMMLIFPFQIYYFGSFPCLTFFSNMVLGILASLESILGFLSLFTMFIPYIGEICLQANFVFLRIFIILIEQFSHLPFPVFTLPRPDLLCMIGYYWVIVFSFFRDPFLYRFTKGNIKTGRKVIAIGTIFFLLYMISVNWYRLYLKDFVCFFHVEQGNMAMIRENRKVVVIDMGSTKKGLASSVLKNFCRATAISKIDAIILTHMHEDHVNGIGGVIENADIKVDQVVFAPMGDKMEGESCKVQEILEKNNIRKIEIEQKDQIQIGKIKMQMLSPPNDQTIQDSDELNANSLMVLITTKGKHYLFMGDATIATERVFIENIEQQENKEEIIKALQHLEAYQVGHHGSKTSTSDAFLQYIKARYAIISSKKEVYGHPDEQVVEKLQDKNMEVWETQKRGALYLK